MVKSVLLLIAVSSSFLFAQRPESSFDLGAGVLYTNSVYKGNNSKVLPIPMFFYQQDQFLIAGRWAQYKLLKEGGFEFALLGQWRFDGYESSDSRYLEGMSKRRMSIDGGAVVSYNDGWGQTRVSFVNDLLSHHKGNELSISYGKRFIAAKNFSITPSLGVLHKSSNLTNYYYGVRQNEATADREAYDVGSVWNPFASVQFTYRLDESWSAMGLLSYERLDSDIKSSPIVGDSYQGAMMLGLMYSF